MSSASNAFNYIVCTTHEDQKVAKTLAGWRHDDPQLPTLRDFDLVVAQRVGQLQAILFTSCCGFTGKFDIRDDDLEVPMATAILHFHDMLQLAPTAPYITRVRYAIDQLSISETELETWALTIRTDLIHIGRSKGGARAQQLRLITLAMWRRNKQNPRAEAPSSHITTETNSAVIGVCKPASNRRSGAKVPSSVWYEWFSDLTWQQQMDRRRYHEAKLAVAYMRMFLPCGYDVSASG
ncbi:hypothetical protein PHMEG_00031014 [Phytophthora megakarya]|uniref:Uncharacterized protein n=1 Tax=Phytophthora megakarya TaxID=4795 RepID=A0A225V0A1_9STRA|nr:hypothetical protein PHMEG_00031014 [Phytophthora megakarya]